MKTSPLPLRGQFISGIGILVVGCVHTLAHLLIPQAREALFGIFAAGVFNTLGPDWAAANFSVLMSLVLGGFIILTGLMIIQAAKSGWMLPRPAALLLTGLFLFVVIAGPNGGGWLALPFCGYLVNQSRTGSSKNL